MAKLSVAMTTYNGENFVEKQLLSLLNQTRKADEVIIRDDCSGDRTAEIVRSFIHTHQPEGWSFAVNESNLGYKRNFRETIAQTSGDIVFLSDQDDLWNPEKLETMELIFEKAPEVLALNSSFEFIDGNNQPLSAPCAKGSLNHNLIHCSDLTAQADLYKVGLGGVIYSNISPGCTMAFRKEIKEIYLANTKCDIVHDWELNFIAAAKGGLYYCDLALIGYRIHGGNAVGMDNIGGGGSENPLDYRFRLAKAKELYEHIVWMDRYFFLLNKGDIQTVKRHRAFLEKRLKAFENRNLFQVISLYSFWKNYRRIITLKGRLADLACVLLPCRERE